MFLPALLVRDYGFWAWVIFAVPNVVGAGGMGWVLGRPGSSERLVARHRPACVAFSAVTLAFHAFFLAWIATYVVAWQVCVGVVIAASALACIDRKRPAIDLIMAIIVLVVSCIILVRFCVAGNVLLPLPRYSAGHLIGIAPVCVLGFVLCPYLDLTFHRARQAVSTIAARWAFGLGFGVFFFSMIVLTLLYSGGFIAGSKVIRTWIAIQLCVQIGFTWVVHLRAVPKPRGVEIPIWVIAAALAVAGGLIVWLPGLAYFWQGSFGPEMASGELVYRLFMAFYGLVFPAYVWLFMVPIGGRTSQLCRRSLIVLAIAVAIAAPMFWLGFVANHTMWLLPGVAVVLLSRLVARASRT